MTRDRLNHVISKIDLATRRLETVKQPAPVPPPPAAPDPDLKRQIEERDRTIAKLRADIEDICQLKDEEIARLRSEMDEAARAKPLAPAPPDRSAEVGALEARCARLESGARNAIARIDALIESAETTGD